MRTERIPCPVHGGSGANCAVWCDARGRKHARCWSHGCPEMDILAALGEVNAPIARASDAQRMQSIAMRIWRQTLPAAHTLVEVYLSRRGIRLSIPPALSFHPRLKHPSGVFAPAMVAAVRNGNGTLVAVHRTYLATDGNKAKLNPQKAALGTIAGGAVALAPVADVVAIGEGIETMLSVQQATHIASWAALGASNLPSVELPANVREVIVCADPDAVGEVAALRAARRFVRQGRQVRIARTGKAGADFNDLRL